MNKPNVEILEDKVIKKNIKNHEFAMHTKINEIIPEASPKIINYDVVKNTLTMEKIQGNNLYDIYGDDFNSLPDNIYLQIKHIINVLYSNNVLYIDITPFNFIEDNGKIFIIDFEHSCFLKTNKKSHVYVPIKNTVYSENHRFVKKFLKNLKSWNPYFE